MDKMIFALLIALVGAMIIWFYLQSKTKTSAAQATGAQSTVAPVGNSAAVLGLVNSQTSAPTSTGGNYSISLPSENVVATNTQYSSATDGYVSSVSPAVAGIAVGKGIKSGAI
jgi:hypothetical protein